MFLIEYNGSSKRSRDAQIRRIFAESREVFVGSNADRGWQFTEVFAFGRGVKDPLNGLQFLACIYALAVLQKSTPLVQIIHAFDILSCGTKLTQVSIRVGIRNETLRRRCESCRVYICYNCDDTRIQDSQAAEGHLQGERALRLVCVSTTRRVDTLPRSARTRSPMLSRRRMEL